MSGKIGFEKKWQRMEWKRGAVNWKSIAHQTEGDDLTSMAKAWMCAAKRSIGEARS